MSDSAPNEPPGAPCWIVRVSGVKGPFSYVTGLPEEIGPQADALHLSREGAFRLSMELCKLGWTAYADPLRATAFG